MKPKENSLERLFRSAAQAGRTLSHDVPYTVEAGVLAGFRRVPESADDWFSFLPLFRRGLAMACFAAVAVIAVSFLSPHTVMDEAAALNAVTEIHYLP